MKKSTKIALIISIVLIFCGGALVVTAFAIADFDIKNFNIGVYEKNTYEINGDINDIFINEVECDIRILPSNDGICRVIVSENRSDKGSVKLENGTLKIDREKNKEWYEFISLFDFNDYELTVYLPEKSYNSIKIDSVSSDICILGALEFKSARIESVSGDIELRNVEAEKETAISTVSGDVELAGFDSGSIEIDTISGDVEGSLLSPKNFEVDTTSGDIELPRSDTSAGKCYISTTSGDVELHISDGIDQ